MIYQNDYITRTIKTRQMNEYIQQAETDRLIAKLNAQQPNRWIEFARGALHAMGHALMAIGRRLDHITTPRPTPISDAVTSKS